MSGQFSTSAAAAPHQPTEPVAPTSRRSARKLAWVIGAIGVAAGVVLAVLYGTAAGDRDDARQTLADTEANLADSDLELAETEAKLTDAEQRLGRSTADLANLEAKIAHVETQLATASADLADRDSIVSEYHDSTSAFLALVLTNAVEISLDQATCTAEALLESLGPATLGRMAGTESANLFGLETLRAASACGVPMEVFDPLTGFTYGDDATLDILHDECAAGIGASCDELYQRSAAGSEYESFALTCGHRFDVSAAPAICEGNI